MQSRASCSLLLFGYPTRVAPAPLFLTGVPLRVQFAPMLCLIAFEMQVANQSPPADGKSGFTSISHGAGGLSLNRPKTCDGMASHGYVVAPLRTREERTTTSPVSAVWVGRPKRLPRHRLRDWKTRTLGSHIQGERIGSSATQRWRYAGWPSGRREAESAAIVAHCRQHPDDSKSAPTVCCDAGKAPEGQADNSGCPCPRVRAIVAHGAEIPPLTDDTRTGGRSGPGCTGGARRS